MTIAKVEPLTTARALRGPFDYRIPADWEPLAVGNVLRVPFGRQRLVGVVTGLAEHSDVADEKLAEPLELVSLGPPPELIELALWLGAEYVSTPARALGLVMPPGTGAGGVKVRQQKVTEVEATDAGRAALDDGTRLGPLQRATVQWLGDGRVSLADLAAAVGADRSAITRLEGRGLVATHDVDAASRRPLMPSVGVVAGEIELNSEQQAAVDSIVAAIQGKGGREQLLHGVTGSGKTEVYLAAARAALDLGKGAIVLVPEIALTPQAVARFRARLGDGVAVIHSGLKPTERFDEWQRLRRGEARIVVGPRSAVFAPVLDVGLIVVDEEHESSYKQEGDPRYDARAVARRRAAQAGAALMVGTATPRPESWLALDRIELPNRVDGGKLPTVEILDMRGGKGTRGPLHERTREELAKLVAANGKAMILLNRRGWSPHMDCGDCGHVWGCPSCDVSLVHHSRAGTLVCHHCGHSEPTPRSCPECGSVSIANHGAGTEQLEALIERELAPLPVFRLDADTARAEGSHAKVLRRFQDAAHGALVGTQMIAKGHDFADVGLGVVLDADSSLRFPDFRAEERTFSLITQLAGRCGRGGGEGLVLVQTLAPSAESIRAAAMHDSEGFLGAELERRHALRYPPYSNVIQIELGAPDERDVERAAQGLKGAIAPALPDGASVLGPAPLFRRRDLHRRRLVIKTGKRAAAIHAVRGAIEGSTRGLKGITVSVDVDPQ